MMAAGETPAEAVARRWSVALADDSQVPNIRTGSSGVFASLAVAATAAPAAQASSATPAPAGSKQALDSEDDQVEEEEEDDLFGTSIPLSSLVTIALPPSGASERGGGSSLDLGLLQRAEFEMDVLHQLAATPEQMARLFTEATIHPELTAKNRYSNIIPTRSARVLLPSSSSNPTLASTYINACSFPPLLPGCQQRYISTQAPLPSTRRDFWCMVWHERAEIVLMLTRETERDGRGNSHAKAHAYWPQQQQQAAGASGSDGDLPTAQYGEFTVTLLSVRSEPDIIVRELLLTRNVGVAPGGASSAIDAPRVVHQLQYVGWPDFGVPDDSDETAGFLHAFKLYRQIREQLRQQKEPKQGSIANAAASATPSSEPAAPALPPVIVHCSAGVGRSGVLIAIDALLDSIAWQQQQSTAAAAAGSAASAAAAAPARPLSVDLFSLTRRMRQYRQGMLQTKEQYAYCLHFVASCMRKGFFGVREEPVIDTPGEV